MVEKKTPIKYDVAIVGGGPAGMMAAISAGKSGASVVLLEKNKELGKKLLITGNGRCNFTSKTDGLRGFVNKFGDNGKFLFSALSKFSVDDVITFFKERGVEAKIEACGKVFPKSDRSKDILKALLDSLEQFKVDIKTNASVSRIIASKNSISGLELESGDIVEADKYIICTGGKSFPQTGSSGDAYAWAGRLGHTIIEPAPALTSIVLADHFLKDLQGISLSEVKLNLFKNNKKTFSEIGDIMFTGNGLGGPLVMDASRSIARENQDILSLDIDLFPNSDEKEVDSKLLDIFGKESNKTIKNCLEGMFPSRLVAVMFMIFEVDPGKKVNSVSKDERKSIVSLIKKFKLSIKGLSGFERAYITSGGIALNEIDPKTMRSKIVDNLYFAGEVLDLDGPSGGYNLQVCWSTGYVAGNTE